VSVYKPYSLAAEEIKSLDRLAAIVERCRRATRLVRWHVARRQTEEQIRGPGAVRDARAHRPASLDVVKAEGSWTGVRDEIARALLGRIPRPSTRRPSP